MRAQTRLSASVVFTDPVVISSDIMKDNKPVNLKRNKVSTCHECCREAGTQTSLQHSTRDSTVDRVSPDFRKGSVEALTEAGWKSDIEKHIFLSGAKRPEGVNI